jgi:hypothetical protein
MGPGEVARFSFYSFSLFSVFTCKCEMALIDTIIRRVDLLGRMEERLEQNTGCYRRSIHQKTQNFT